MICILKVIHLYVQNNILLLFDVFDNFKNMCIKIYELHPAKFLSASGLAWQAGLKKTKVKLNLFLTDIDMLLMVKRDIRGERCHSIYTRSVIPGRRYGHTPSPHFFA